MSQWDSTLHNKSNWTRAVSVQFLTDRVVPSSVVLGPVPPSSVLFPPVSSNLIWSRFLFTNDFSKMSTVCGEQLDITKPSIVIHKGELQSCKFKQQLFHFSISELWSSCRNSNYWISQNEWKRVPILFILWHQSPRHFPNWKIRRQITAAKAP